MSAGFSPLSGLIPLDTHCSLNTLQAFFPRIEKLRFKRGCHELGIT
jgi:hypothetical protein